MAFAEGILPTFFRLTLNTTTKKRRFFISHIISLLFLTVSLLLSVVLWPEEGDFPENLHRVVYVLINKRSFWNLLCVWIS